MYTYVTWAPRGYVSCINAALTEDKPRRTSRYICTYAFIWGHGIHPSAVLLNRMLVYLNMHRILHNPGYTSRVYISYDIDNMRSG